LSEQACDALQSARTDAISAPLIFLILLESDTQPHANSRLWNSEKPAPTFDASAYFGVGYSSGSSEIA
jgi:hypothetical protein